MIKAIEDAGRKALALPGDLQDIDQCQKTVEETVTVFGGLDILVNNTSRQIAYEGIEDIPDEEFDATMKSNVYSAFRVTKAAVPHLEGLVDHLHLGHRVLPAGTVRHALQPDQGRAE